MKTLKEYKDEEKCYIFSQFYHKDAYALGSYLTETAIERRNPVAIEIEIDGDIVYRYLNDGASESNFDWIRKKRNVVKHFQMSSGALAAKLKERNQTFQEVYGEDKSYAVAAGAFPIRVENVGMIGSVGISGLSSEEDHALIIEGMNELLKYQGKLRMEEKVEC